MKLLRILALGLAVLACASVASAGSLSSGLQEQVRNLDETDVITVLVVMQDQADIASLDWDLHVQKSSLAVRHQTVVETLQSIAKQTQGGLLNDLGTQKAQGGIEGWTPHWLINAVVVRGTVEAIREIARRPDVEIVEPDLVVDLIEPVRQEPMADLSPADLGVLPGIQAINAPQVWEELGNRGAGALVGIIDTGVDGSHPALADRWRGNFAPAQECWIDVIGYGDTEPTDHHYHGTHVMGTVCGLAPGDSIGVAPEALWIASNAIDQSTGPGFDNDIIASLEFMADPDGDPQTNEDVPDVVQNSWRVNEYFSGYFDCDSRWWDAIDNCEAAGVVTTWSAGNEGPSAESVGSPADRADSPTNCFSVGSTMHSPPYNLSSFSSRGPSGCGGEFAMKPEVVAPGSNILSAQPGGGYQYLDGTSMAGPHVAGVVALMRAANPNLDVITIKEVLMNTAVDLGSAGEDNQYGNGFIDAYQAVLFVMGGIGTVQGTVTDVGTGLPIDFATVHDVGGFNTQATDANGEYVMTLTVEEHTLEFAAFGYYTQQHTLNVVEDDITVLDVALVQAPQTRLWGYVFGADDLLLAGATITALGTPVDPVYSDAGGYYEIYLPDGAAYEIQATAPGLTTLVATVDVDGETQQNFILQDPDPVFPEVDLSFTSVDFTILPGDQRTQSRYLVNRGQANLNYWILTEPVENKSGRSVQQPVTTWPQVELAKGESDPRPGSVPITGQGGPDAYGYEWIDSDEPGGPVYEWFEINDIGSIVGGGDDESHGPFPLGITFNFYGTSFDALRVCTNGFLSFTSTSAPYTNEPIPSTSQPNNLVAPFWDDLNPNSGGTIYYYQDIANARFVVQWDGVPHWNNGGPETFQVLLNANGSIVYQYKTVDTGNSCTVGIENAGGTDGLQVVFNGAHLHDEMAIRLALAPEVPWLEVQPAGGVIGPGQRQRLDFLYDAAELAVGDYQASMTIYTNDPVNDAVVVPITLYVSSDLTDVGDGEAPAVFALQGVHPNPFNPLTEISFSLPSAGAVDLNVYDVSGKLVRSLLSEQLPAGVHRVRWNGADDSGQGVASGTYFARLTSGERVDVKSMVLVR